MKSIMNVPQREVNVKLIKKPNNYQKDEFQLPVLLKWCFYSSKLLKCSPSNLFSLRPQCTARARQLTSILSAASPLLLETKHPPAAQVKFAICFNCYSKVKCAPPEKGNMLLTSLVHSIVCTLLP